MYDYEKALNEALTRINTRINARVDDQISRAKYWREHWMWVNSFWRAAGVWGRN